MEGEKIYFKNLIELTEFNTIVNVYDINRLDKIQRLEDGKMIYGIVVNNSPEPISNRPINIEAWYNSYEEREERWRKIRNELEAIGIQIIKI